MRRTVFIFWLFFSCVSAATPALAEEEKDEPPATEEFPDFSVLRDPFLSALPVEEIIKTLIEPPGINNNNKQQSMAKASPLSQAPAPLPVLKPEKPVLPAFNLQGIVWGSDQPQAIINNKVFGIGDSIQGFKIKSISKNDIDLTSGGEEFHVHMDK